MSNLNLAQRPVRTLSVPHPRLPRVQIRRINIGEIVARATPLLLQTLLGSCVAVCLRDPVAGIGGMNHILLPGRSGEDRSSRFGVNAMELLINAIMNQGGDRRRLVAKVFGAANVLAGPQSPTVGELNATFVRDFLATEKVPLVARRLGGTHAVQVHFKTDTGKTIVHPVDGSRLPAILSAEGAYHCGFARAGSGGDIAVFCG
jgi:chemotaxis receptor (MCP) glutamine deamidase CheD